LHQFIVDLQAEEESIGHLEVAGEPQIRVGSNGPLAQYDLVDAARGHADGIGKRSLRQLHRSQEILHQDFAWMRIVKELSGSRRFRLGAHVHLSGQNRSAIGR